MGSVFQIKQWHTTWWLPKMLEAMLDSIKMGTPIVQGLFDSLLNLGGWILLMEPEHPDKRDCSSSGKSGVK